MKKVIITKLLIITQAFLLFFGGELFAQSKKSGSALCNNLQMLITSAQTSNLGDIKKDAIGADNYSTKISLQAGDAMVHFDKNIKTNIYEETWPLKQDTSQSLLKFANNIFSCLPKTDWTLMQEGDSMSGISYVIANLQNRTFMNVSNLGNTIKFTLYKQEQSTAKCISGDCVNGFGKMQYETGDVYEGQFLNSQRIGMGKYIWAADKSYYEGSWLSDTMNGFGTYYKPDGTKEKESYLMLGNYIDLDTSKKDFCQYGDCKNGFGLYYYNGGQLYLGHFQFGLQNGLGLYESKDGIYYGEFAVGKYNGTGLVFSPSGTVLRASFVNGQQQGNGKETKMGESVIEGSYEDSVLVGAEYTPEGILQKIGTWKDGKYVPTSSREDKKTIEFAESLAKIYAYRTNKYGRLRGNLKKSKGVVYYDALFNIKNTENTYVREETDQEPYVRAVINRFALPKDQAIAKYEWAVRTVRKSLNSTWKSDPGKTNDTAEFANRNHTFINMENKESFIDVRVVENMVYIDIH
jgi:hypothetical protein